MLRSIVKQSGESVESVREKKVGYGIEKICGKGKFKAWSERVKG